MNLYEFEGKNLFQKYKIPVPTGRMITEETKDITWEQFPCVVKAQVQSGKRGKNGGILFAKNKQELEQHIQTLLGKKICNDEVWYLLIEEKIPLKQEYYLSITYNTQKRVPTLLFATAGGMGIEEENAVLSLDINPLRILESFRVRALLKQAGVKANDLLMKEDIAKRLFRIFEQEDARLVEINPLAKTEDGRFMALDAKIALDEDAGFRHDWKNFPERTTLGRRLTERERAVRNIDQGEFYYRGTAGKYIEIDGDIACLFSGGGASISMMDTLYALGQKPSNYTEYSGNPPREKVQALTNIVLSKPGLKGIWVVGGVANFTHIGETMAGIADALRVLKPKVPIVIRRAGPHEDEGKKIMENVAKECHLNLKWFGREISMGKSAKVLVDMIHKL